METLDPNLVGTVSLVAGLAVALLGLGLRSKMLELREVDRRCASCRRLVRRGTVCPCAH